MSRYFGINSDTSLNDSDNDGITNDIDTSDYDPTNTTLDADADSDGLIEINNLEQLNAIRYQLSGAGRVLTDGGVVDSSGCPAKVVQGKYQLRCQGYELTSDLDFDTNADGVMDANDSYWNAGRGWEPIGKMPAASAFASTFEGNDHIIRNLYIDRTSDDIGLFGYLSGAEIYHLGLTGELMQVSGRSRVGGLAGFLNNSNIKESYSTGLIASTNGQVGGLVGSTNTCSISASFSTGSVTSSGSSFGGLVGYVNTCDITASFATGKVTSILMSYTNSVGGLAGKVYNSSIDASFATGFVQGNSLIGGLVGQLNSSAITNSYWGTDSTAQSNSSYSSDLNGYIGDTLEHLKCPTSADNSDCGNSSLYTGWANYIYTKPGKL